MLLLQARLHRLLELVERFEAERFGKRVVDGDAGGHLDRFRRDLELGFLSGQVRRRIAGRERHLHLPRLTGRHADQLVLEAGNERARPDIDADIAAGAALERLTVELAGEIDHDPVALLDLRALPLGGERPVLLGDLAQRLADLRLGHLGNQALELDALEIGELDLRQDFERQRIGQVGLPADDLFDLGLFVRDRDLGLHGELEAVIADDLGVHLADDGLDGLRHHGAAIDLLEVRDRDLARAEAVDADAILEVAEPLDDPCLQIGRRDGDLVFALEAVGQGFGDLHGDNLLLRSGAVVGRGIGRRPVVASGLGVVRAEGLEPPRLSSREPKSRASTNSATPAEGTPRRRTGGAAYITRQAGRTRKIGAFGKLLNRARAGYEAPLPSAPRRPKMPPTDPTLSRRWFLAAAGTACLALPASPESANRRLPRAASAR